MFTLKNFLNVFINSIAGSTCGAAIYITIFDRDASLSYIFLWEIIGLAVLCALGNVIYASHREISKRDIKIRFLLHYFYINAAVIGWAYFCHWIRPITLAGTLILILIIAIVYIFVSTYSIKSDKKVAMKLNERLRKVNREDE